MKNLYTAPLRKLAFTALLGLGSIAVAQAQSLNYSTGNALNTTTAYTDLGTTGTAITTANTDDANSTATPIGFTFNFNGTSFTDFVLSTNGFIKLGTTAPSAANLYYTPETTIGADAISSTDPADVNLLIPFNVDLLAGTATGGAEYRVATTGTAPNRVTTIQWKNVRDKNLPPNSTGTSNSPQYDSFSFQVKLYETTNNVEFVYGAATAGTTGADAFRIAGVGIKGSGSASGQTVLVNKTSSAAAWSTAVFITGNYTTSAFNYRRAGAPDAGRTFRFGPAVANDAAVQTVYALGKTPANSAQIIQAVIRNAGSAALSNVAVALNVSGANTFATAQTVASLAPGASTVVSFPSFTPTANGTNTITVTVPTDGVASNNTQTYSQQVQATTFAYYNPALTTSSSSAGFNMGGGILAVKFSTTIARTATSVAARIEDTNSVGNTIYGVLLDANGAIVGRSANYTVATADIGTLKSFALTTPATLAAGSTFYAGVAQVANATTGYFPVGTQSETPTRTGAVYAVALAGGTPSDVTAAPANANIGMFIIEAVTNTVQGTSAALNRAVSLYPNPSTGVVNLDVRGANAKGNLNVSVINVLGQAVYTSSLKDNFTNEVNLSSLANGVYTLKVQTGNEFTTRQLVLTK